MNNIPETGAIEIKSNIISAEGVSEKEVTYIDGEYADLRDNSVTFDEGYEIDGDFTKIFKFSKPKRNSVIKEFGTTDKLKVKIYYRQGSYSDSNGEKGYFELVANSCGINYIVNSNYVDILAGDYYYIYSLLVNRKNGYFDLKALAKGTLIRYSPNSNGSNMTDSRQPNSQYVGIGYMPNEIVEHENLILNSTGNLGNISKWNCLSTSNMTLNVVDGPALELIDKRVNPTNRVNVYQNGIINKKSGKVTVSFEYKATTNSFVGSSGIGVLIRADTTENPYTDIISITSSMVADDKWHTLKGVGDLSVLEGKTINQTLFYLFTRNGTVTYKNVKLEYGDAATPWTPAPSDWLSDPSNYVWTPL
ncbi:hypothetical protein [Clostridium sp. 3-3]|uniref:hypothetical protein n=1 Tax=Clostridium sp. 3-3 TaxID=2070757 RepID=UPI001A9A321F|nr:hypothetical protein [Clostridium sp. 3-3]